MDPKIIKSGTFINCSGNKTDTTGTLLVVLFTII